MQPTITTEHLVLTVAGPERAAAFAAFNVENENRLTPWEPPWQDGATSAAYWEKKLVEWQDEAVRGVSCRFAMFERVDGRAGALVGQANFTNIVRGALQACNLGYRIGGAFEGRGLMYEAMQGALAFAFATLRLHRINANYQPTNVRSGALLRRLGFVVEGYARDYLYVGGRWTDHILTSLVNPGWEGGPPELR